MARLALSDDFIAVPVLGQHGLVALPEGFMSADLHSKDAADLQRGKVDWQLSTVAIQQTP